MKKKVVCIGGGNGASTIIKSLKKYSNELEISAVVPMTDSGGSSGKLREELNVLPPGDIMRAVLAMSKYDSDFLKEIFYYTRFKNLEKLNDHNFGNLFLALVGKYTNDFVSAVRAMENSLGAIGKVYPIITEQAHLVVEIEDGSIVKTESKIDRPEYDRKLKIKKAWLEPNIKIYEEASKVIEEADYLILGPGSLYTSIVAAILPQGTKEAIENSKAKLIYVTGSIFEKKGETGPERLSDFVKELQMYLPKKIDLILHNDHKLNKMEKEKYTQKQWGILEFDPENIPEYEVISREYEEQGKFDNEKLGKILIKLMSKTKEFAYIK